MRLTFRARLFVIVGTAASAFVLLFIAGTLTSARTERRLSEVQQRFLPKLELGPRLESQFERLRRALQDAVAASDPDALSATRALETKLLEDVSSAGAVLSPGQMAAVRSALDDYYLTAIDVSRRLLGGETGERLVDSMTAMQAKQTHASDLLASVTSFDRRELTAAFADARAVQRTGANIRLVAIVSCLLLVLILSAGVSRSLIRSLAQVSRGLARFGRGDFSRQIAVESDDEIGELARQANHMASSLEQAAATRDRSDWIKGALAGLVQELRGELEPDEVASRAVTFLARYLEAPAAALYAVEAADGSRSLRLLGRYGVSGEAATGVPDRFALGEGLVGEAARSDEITIVRDPPAGYMRVRSALGEASPTTLVLLPLRQLGQPRGVLELAFFGTWSARAEEALLLVRENLLIAIEVAKARAAMRDLLAETERQAQLLREQEDELRASNEELQAQQEELRQSNEALAEQTEELETQQRELERNNNELEQARRVLEQKATELASVSAYKSQFLANMSHELRTPLNSMLLLSNLLAENGDRNLTEKQIEFAKTIHGAGQDLLALINQVLDLSKIEAGKQDITIASVSPRGVVEQMRRRFGPLAREKRIGFEVEVAPEVPESVSTDGRRLEQILTNLIGNAIKFTEHGQVKLSVGLRSPGTRHRRADLQAAEVIAFAVADTGLGIEAKDRERIFVPFEQVDGAIDRRYGGTGLGLSIATELAALLGGELDLSSEVGKGSTFVFYLPLTPPSAGATTAGPAEATSLVIAATTDVKPTSSSAADNSSESNALLVIEDDDAAAEALAEIIRRQGLDCLVARDGDSGLRLAQEHRPAGIILDIRLPDTDGWSVIAALKEDRRTAGIPVHVVSALAGAERALALGAIGYLVKPAPREALLQVIASVTPTRGRAPQRVLVVEDDAATSDSVVRHLAGEGMEVRRAMTAAEALDVLGHERFTCIVLDLGLPDMDGLTLLEELRERHGAAMPSVIVYTARALSKEETRVLEAYAESIVLKDGPSTERLRDEVRLFVRRLKDGTLGRLRPDDAIRGPVTRDVNLVGKKILVADDDMRTVYALSASLLGKGAEVLVADTGRAAVAMLEQHADVDAVIMDIMMPEMDGYQAMRQIREKRQFRDLVIIALSAKAMKGERDRCLEAGATEYLSKPVDGDRLLALVQALLKHAA